MIEIKNLVLPFNIGLGIRPVPTTLSNGNVAVLWKNSEISVSIYDYDGSTVLSAFTANVEGTGAYWYDTNLARAIDSWSSGNFIVCWHTQVNTLSNTFDVRCGVFDNVGNRLRGDIHVTDNHYHNSGLAVTTLANDNYAVAWIAQGEVRAMILNDQDKAVGSLTIHLGAGLDPTMATLSNKNLLIIWENNGLIGCIYNSTTAFLIRKFTVSSDSSAIQPDVLTLQEGGFATCWQYNSDGSLQGIKCAIFDQNANIIKSAFQINQYTPNNQAEVSITELESKKILSCWHSEGQNSGKAGIYCRAFTYQGEFLTDEFLAMNSTYSHVYPIITSHDNKMFVTSAGENSVSQNVIQATIWELNNNKDTNNEDTNNEEYCLKLKKLQLGSIGDLDRTNEEIEIGVGIESNNQIIECGLFLFDINKNQKDKDLNFEIPCKKGTYVDVRLYERDLCSDDMVLTNMLCEESNNPQSVKISITPEATSYANCISSSKTIEACATVTTGGRVQVGGSFCSSYEWGETECKEVSETASEYHLTYNIELGQCALSYEQSLQSGESCIEKKVLIIQDLCVEVYLQAMLNY